jgi:hypothetical protein
MDMENLQATDHPPSPGADNPSPPAAENPPRLSSRLPAWLTASVVVLIIVLAVGAATAANRAGWIPHRQETTVYIGVAGWEVGQYRDCVALPESNGSMIFLGCVGRRRAEMSPDVWPVTYWGQVHRKDMFELIHQDPVTYAWKWRCRRHEGSLTCWAVN